MQNNFQIAFNAMMKLADHAKLSANKFPDDSSFKYTWNEKSEVYKNCAGFLMEACVNEGIFLEVENKPVKESNLNPVFDQIFKNLY